MALAIVAACASVTAQAADSDTEQGIEVVSVEPLATIQQIDQKNRTLAALETDLEIAEKRAKLNSLRGQSGDRAGDALIAALQNDLKGAEPATPARQGESASTASAASSAPAWSVYSIGGFAGSNRAVLVNDQGQRMPVDIGTKLPGAGTVVAINRSTVRVKQGGHSRLLPTAASYSGSSPAIKTRASFERQATRFAGGGSDSTQGGE